MKIIRFLVVVAVLGFSASLALADTTPTDPVLLTSGCGKAGQPPCDAYLITSPTFTQMVTLTLDTNSSDPFFGDDTASFVNISGTTLTTGFSFSVPVPTGLSFQGCGTPPEGVTTLFTCTGGGSPSSPITSGTAVFTLSGASICSANSDDLQTTESGVTYYSDSDNDDNCTAAFTIALQPVAGETLPQSISGTFSAPEPSSALLLLFGLAAGLFALKGFRGNLV